MRFHCFCDVHMCLQGYEYFIESSKLWRYSSRVVTRRDGANPSAILQITLCLSIYVYNFTCTLLCRIPVYLFRSFPGKGPRGNPGWIHCFFSQCHNSYHYSAQSTQSSLSQEHSQPAPTVPTTHQTIHLLTAWAYSEQETGNGPCFVCCHWLSCKWVSD